MSKPATGPRSDAGKERSSVNAATHGLCSDRPVLPCEDADVWDAFHDGIVQELDPVGILERELADRIALQLWRLRRVARFEAKVGTDLYEDATSKAAGAMIGLSPDNPEWQALYQAHHDLDDLKEDMTSAEAARTLVAQLPILPDHTVVDPTVVLLLVQLLGDMSVIEVKQPMTAALLRLALPTTSKLPLPETLKLLTAACAEHHQEVTEEIAAKKKRFEKIADDMAQHVEAQSHDHELLQKPGAGSAGALRGSRQPSAPAGEDALEKLQAKRQVRDEAARSAAPPRPAPVPIVNPIPAALETEPIPEPIGCLAEMAGGSFGNFDGAPPAAALKCNWPTRSEFVRSFSVAVPGPVRPRDTS